MHTFFEVHPFLPLDLSLVRRLTPQGVSLDSIINLTRGINTVEGAVWGALPLADLGTPTFVIRESDGGYVAQFRHKAGDSHAHIVFIAPDVASNTKQGELAWLHLLDAMVVAAGRRGAHTLNAEVNEGSAAFEVLGQAGFATYARQEIWQRLPAAIPAADTELIRPSMDSDAIEIQVLYASVVPRLVMQADALPEVRSGSGLVYERDGKIVAYLALHEGKYGLYVQPFMNPDASVSRAQAILAAMLSQLPRADRLPVYVSVRRYQSWLRTALHALDFDLYSKQAVMVKHTACRVEQPVLRPAYPLDRMIIQLVPPAGSGEGWQRMIEPEIIQAKEAIVLGISYNRRSGKTQVRPSRLSGRRPRANRA